MAGRLDPGRQTVRPLYADRIAAFSAADKPSRPEVRIRRMSG